MAEYHWHWRKWCPLIVCMGFNGGRGAKIALWIEWYSYCVMPQPSPGGRE